MSWNGRLPRSFIYLPLILTRQRDLWHYHMGIGLVHTGITLLPPFPAFTQVRASHGCKDHDSLSFVSQNKTGLRNRMSSSQLLRALIKCRNLIEYASLSVWRAVQWCVLTIKALNVPYERFCLQSPVASCFFSTVWLILVHLSEMCSLSGSWNISQWSVCVCV